MTGQTIGSYMVTRRLGKGTYGQCFAAVGRDGVSVALKKIPYDSFDEYLHLFFREISILKSLSHPGVVRVMDVFAPNTVEQIYIVMELMTSDLRAYVKHSYADRRVPLDTAQLIFSQMVSAVGYCHSRNVWHRDLKPQNILIDWESTRIKIADFGLAKNVSWRQIPSKVPLTHEIVTLWYRAPEVILGCSTYTSAIDVYSMGTVLFELLAGKSMLTSSTEVGTLIDLFSLLGTPCEDICPGCSAWTYFSDAFPRWSSEGALERIGNKLPPVPNQVIEIIESMVRINALNRVTCNELLTNSFITVLA